MRSGPYVVNDQMERTIGFEENPRRAVWGEDWRLRFSRLQSEFGLLFFINFLLICVICVIGGLTTKIPKRKLNLAQLGGRLTVRLRTLDPPIGVRIPASQ